MAGTDDADDGRLAGRRPRASRRAGADAGQAGRNEGTEDEEIDTVTRIMGFLRGDEEDEDGV
jgi:hypothetical protein